MVEKKVANERWQKKRQQAKDGRKESSQRKMVEKKVANERQQKRKQPTKDGRKESSKRKMTEKKGRIKAAI